VARSRGSLALPWPTVLRSVEERASKSVRSPADDRAEITPDASAVVGKHRGDAVNVTGAGVAGDKALDQLARAEGAGVGMVEQRDEGVSKVLGAALGGPENFAGDDGFHRVIVERRIKHHRVEVILTETAAAGEARIGGLVEAPTREDFGHLHDGILGVGRNGLTVDVEP